MRPPIILYSVFVEEFLVWFASPHEVSTLIQFLCLRCTRQFKLEHTEWIAYLAPGSALLLFACSTTGLTNYVRQRVFMVTPPRIVLIVMRASVVLWAFLTVVSIFFLQSAFEAITFENGQGDLVELYRNKLLVAELIAAVTLFQLFRPSWER